MGHDGAGKDPGASARRLKHFAGWLRLGPKGATPQAAPMQLAGRVEGGKRPSCRQFPSGP